ncbi:DUF4013 domain-containing protein [Haloarcula marina]|uniref:DUF4013 domain-containing protein n=1 Tax=Haloarcula marina TaxID=2961574 RepID=UPI0020B70FFE|nr:DUF4013 domain-containing protein [Halomicroarcula marina]
MAQCGACGEPVAASHAFCPACGAEQDASDSAGESADDPFDRDSFTFGLHYSLRGGYEPMLLGSIVALVGLVVPPLSLFTYGYAFRLTRAAAAGDPDPPAFDGLKRLFVDGLRGVVGVLVVGGVTLVVGASVAAVAEQVGLGGAATDFAVAVVALAGLYVAPAVLTAYAATGRLSRALSGRHAGAFATSKRYLEGFLGWAVLLFAVTLLWLASVLTIVGPAVVTTFAGYVFAGFWGYQYHAAADDGVVPPVAPADSEPEVDDAADPARPPATH